MSISISNLTKKYDSQIVLNTINFEIGQGEVVGFLGPNGAGKTTTMKIITGALGYSLGSVKVCGLEVNDNRLKTNALIGYLPEQNPLYHEMYVKEYLLFVADTHKIDPKKKKKLIDELIDKVGLRSEYTKKIGQLSKGYRQRVGLAQALIPNPKVLILDEPTTGLDPNQLEEIRSLIKVLGQDRTILFSTHIIQEIKAICNRVIIISQGKIVADYHDIAKISLFNDANFQFEVEFLNPYDNIELEKNHFNSDINKIDENKFVINSTSDIRTEIFDFAVRTNNKLILLNKMERSMEDVFRSLTK